VIRWRPHQSGLGHRRHAARVDNAPIWQWARTLQSNGAGDKRDRDTDHLRCISAWRGWCGKRRPRPSDGGHELKACCVTWLCVAKRAKAVGSRVMFHSHLQGCNSRKRTEERPLYSFPPCGTERGPTRVRRASCVDRTRLCCKSFMFSLIQSVLAAYTYPENRFGKKNDVRSTFDS
jgi:hypothetical protein